jgi:hypothetical protein
VINFQTTVLLFAFCRCHSIIPPRRGPEAASIPLQAERIGEWMNELRAVCDDENHGPSLMAAKATYHFARGFQVLNHETGDHEITKIKEWSVFVPSPFFDMFLRVSVM